MTTTIRKNASHEPKRSTKTGKTMHNAEKQAKPTKWGVQLLAKMEVLRKALAA